jgi:GTP-binding protein Era
MTSSGDPPAGAADPFRCGYVALVGAPNVGKSTLMNRLLEERLAIVTAKPQTTRRRTLGILNLPQVQAVLLDTPGLLEPGYDLQQAMLREALSAVEDSDVLLFLVEPESPVRVPDPVRERSVPRILALNKVDRVAAKETLIPQLSAWSETGLFEALIPISALAGDGVAELLAEVTARLPLGPPLYPPDQLAAQPERFFVAEIVRERIFERFQKEVPYAAEVAIEEFRERPGARDYIEALIHVEHESQKAILIGRGGAAIKGLGEEAREHVERFLGRPVFLSLRVKVSPKWRRRADALRRFGYPR